MRPLKVLFTIPNFVTAGSGQALWNVVSRLDRNFFEPSIAVLKKGGKLEPEIEGAGVPVIEGPIWVPAKPYWRLPLRVRSAAKFFRPYEFDFWHSYHYSDQYTEALIARASGAKAWFYTKKNMSWGSNAWRVKSWLAKRVAIQNKAMSSFFSHSCKPFLIPRGVRTDFFRPLEPDPDWLNRLGPNRCQVGSVAHICPRKGILTLIEAMVPHPNCHLSLAGSVIDVEYMKACKERVTALGLAGRVTFLGPVDDVVGYLNALDYFVLASRSEGCPVALLEAMACGVPTIAANFPGAEDIIQNGINGWLFPIDDVPALENTLANAMASDGPAVGGKGRETMLQEFSIDIEVQRHETLYREVFPAFF